MLGKGVIKENTIRKREYWVEDIFSAELLLLKVLGKQALYHPNFQVGDEVYYIRSPYKEGECLWCTTTDFKMDQNMYGLKLELDRKHQEMMEDE